MDTYEEKSLVLNLVSLGIRAGSGHFLETECRSKSAPESITGSKPAKGEGDSSHSSDESESRVDRSLILRQGPLLVRCHQDKNPPLDLIQRSGLGLGTPLKVRVIAWRNYRDLN